MNDAEQVEHYQQHFIELLHQLYLIPQVTNDPDLPFTLYAYSEEMAALCQKKSWSVQDLLTMEELIDILHGIVLEYTEEDKIRNL